MANSTILNLGTANTLDGSEWVWLIQGGTDKRATTADIANTATGFVPTTRSINTGTGLAGGGTLASDRTLTFAPDGLTAASTMAVADSFVIDAGALPYKVTFPLAMKAINGLTVSPALSLTNDKLIVYRAADGLVYYTTPSAIGTAAGNVPAGGTTGQVLSKLSSTNYDTAWTTFTGLSGTLGTTDNMVPRADGTGGQTIQAGNFINDDSGNVYPSSSGVGSLGLTTNMWSNLFLASGGVINWNNGNVTATHSANALAFAGASSGYSFDNTIKQTKGGNAAIVWQNIDGSVGLDMKIQLDTVGRYYEFWLDADGSGYSTAPTLSLTENVVKISSLLNIIASGANPAVTMWDTSSSGWTMFSQSGILRFGNVNSSGAWQANRIDLTTAALAPSTTGGLTLGTTSLMWSDLFLKSGGTINWNNGTFTATQSSTNLAFSGSITSAASGTIQFGGSAASGFYSDGANVAIRSFSGTSGIYFQNASGASTIGIATSNNWQFNVVAIPGSNDGAALGNTTNQWSDLFLASGGVVNWGNGNVTITHSAGALTQTGNLVVGGTISAGTAGSVVGDVIHYNATSGSITLRPVTGALGSSVLTLPAATDTIAVLAASQAFTNKTYNGLTITSSTGTLTVTNGKTLSISNSLTLAGTDSTTMTFPTLSSTVLTTGNAATIGAVGYSVTSYSQTWTSFTVDPTKGNYQYVTNNASSVTITAPASDCAVDIYVLNGASAGAITFSGFTQANSTITGTYATTNTNKYILSIRRINSVSTYSWTPLQ